MFSFASFQSHQTELASVAEEASGFVAVESLVVLLIAATAVGIFAHRIKLPYTVSLVLVGLAMSSLGLVPEIELTHDLLMMVFLPALLFEAAIHFPASELKQYAPTLVTLAVPGVLLTAFTTAFVLEFEFSTLGVDHPASFIHFLLFGTIIAATDPISVITLFRQLGVPRRLSVLLEGEALFNDGTAIVLYSVVLAAIQSGVYSIGGGLKEFVIVAIGGIFVGAVLGLFASVIITLTEDHLISIALTTVTAYGSYLAAEKFHFSGVLAVVTAGLFVGNIGKKKGMTPTSRVAVVSFWEYLSFFVASLVFLLIGLEVDIPFLLNNLDLILLAFSAVLASRVVSVFLPLPLLRRFGQKIDLRTATVMWWGGMRGSLSMVLVLSLPESMGARETLIAMTFGVVVMSVVLQGATMGPLVRLLGLVAAKTDAGRFLGKSLARLKAISAQQEALKELAPSEFSGLKDISAKLHAMRAGVVSAMEARRSEAEFQQATDSRAKILEDHLLEVAKDTYRACVADSLISEHQAADLMAEATAKPVSKKDLPDHKGPKQEA